MGLGVCVDVMNATRKPACVLHPARPPGGSVCLRADVMLDSMFKPYLIEVNRSPAMAVTVRPPARPAACIQSPVACCCCWRGQVPEDLACKTPMLSDVFTILQLDRLPALHASLDAELPLSGTRSPSQDQTPHVFGSGGPDEVTRASGPEPRSRWLAAAHGGSG